MRRLADLLILVAVLAAAALVLPACFGLHRDVVTSGSMQPAIGTGSLVLSRSVAATSVRRGDIITFTAPGRRRAITHRVAGIDREGIHTRGDANRSPDPWALPRAGRVRRVVAHAPAVGYAIVALQMPEVRGLLVALVAAGLGLWLLTGVARELRAGRAEARA